MCERVLVCGPNATPWNTRYFSFSTIEEVILRKLMSQIGAHVSSHIQLVESRLRIRLSQVFFVHSLTHSFILSCVAGAVVGLFGVRARAYLRFFSLVK